MSSNDSARVALITGATTGLGAATTKLFAENGYRVLATGLNDQEGFIAGLKADGLSVEFFPADLAHSQESAREIVASAIKNYKQLDVVVNSAARVSFKPIEEVSEQDWDAIFAVNLKSPFFVAQAAYPHLQKTRGCIINISSTNAWVVNHNNQLYDTLKAGLNHLTKGLARDFRESGVRVNAVMPGAMKTPLVKEWLGAYLGREFEEGDLEGPFVAEPEIVARGILALASENMRWVNGAEIPIDGGYHLGSS
jgi:NAD(P)-dependent dehydrogenase (short-subunit alcohol dehydrogenase family)